MTYVASLLLYLHIWQHVCQRRGVVRKRNRNQSRQQPNAHPSRPKESKRAHPHQEDAPKVSSARHQRYFVQMHKHAPTYTTLSFTKHTTIATLIVPTPTRHVHPAHGVLPKTAKVDPPRSQVQGQLPAVQASRAHPRGAVPATPQPNQAEVGSWESRQARWAARICEGEG